jgi:hypothetical protein
MSAPALENPFAGQGSVLLDIGDDVGAVVVTMPSSMEGEEVEIRPLVQPAGHVHHPHVAVVNRPIAGGLLPSLVFPEVSEGTYGLHLKGSDVRRLTVTVAGGAVASAQWPR